jgi:hypothetical protein
MNPADGEELDWLAFRYVAGELASDKLGDFERRLADDQAACDAVSRAVELTCAIRAAEATTVAPVFPAGRRRHEQSVRLAACAAACALVLIACLGFLLPSESGPAGLSDASHGVDTAELAVVWSEAKSELADQDSPTWASWEPVDSGVPTVTTEDPTELVAPDWMLSALVAVEADVLPPQSEEKKDG